MTHARPMKTMVWVAVCALVACSSAPKVADWQIQARGALDRSIAAYLEGNDRVEAAELARARQHIASTGRPDLLAAAELSHCAARVASLVFGPCAGFETLRPDALEAQKIYADYLGGHIAPANIALLPPNQQIAARSSATNPDALQSIDDPLSLLVATGVLFQSGKASPAQVARAVDTASSQGWRRPLLAWLGVQERYARQAGQTDMADRILRRKALLGTEQK
ncbi:MAG: hypothetical protein K9K38_16410 [Rhodoferax sp.]|nr:hypothetical protein [Rhodoferax sp.]MCF8210961.1 hypothetical protein [Rhodoferax sp.]